MLAYDKPDNLMQIKLNINDALTSSIDENIIYDYKLLKGQYVVVLYNKETERNMIFYMSNSDIRKLNKNINANIKHYKKKGLI